MSGNKTLLRKMEMPYLANILLKQRKPSVMTMSRKKMSHMPVGIWLRYRERSVDRYRG
jgi:hypothetical protein